MSNNVFKRYKMILFTISKSKGEKKTKHYDYIQSLVPIQSESETKLTLTHKILRIYIEFSHYHWLFKNLL